MAQPHAGKRALFTGTGRGIGAAVARRLAAEGAHVTLTYVGSPKEADGVVSEIRAKSGSARSV